MTIVLRQESIADNLEQFELSQKQAETVGGLTLETFEKDALKKSITESPPTPPAADTTVSSSDADSTDTDSTDSDSDDIDDNDFKLETPDIEDPIEDDDDTDDDADDVDEPTPTTDEDDDSDTPDMRKESFRRLKPLSKNASLRLESDGFMSTAGNAALEAWNGFSFVSGVLLSVGIKFAPMVLSGLFKVVLYSFAKTFQLFSGIAEACADRVQRYMNSYEKQQARMASIVTKMKKVLESGATLQDDHFDFPAQYLSTTSGKSPTEVILHQHEVTTYAFSNLLKGALGEFRQLREIADNRYLGKHFDAISYMNVDAGAYGMRSVSGTPARAINGASPFSLGELAGGLECVLYMPNHADDWNTIERNYNAAEFTLIMKPNAHQGESLKPMNPAELSKFLISVNALIESSKRHKLFYDELSKARSGLLTHVKALFVQLVRSQTRVSFKDSVALPLFLKTSLTTKVFLVGAMDIQDHNAKVVMNALTYAERVLKLYRVAEKQETVPSNWD